MWYDTRATGDAWIPCDQVIMSIFLDQTVIRESDTFEVRILDSHVVKKSNSHN